MATYGNLVGAEFGVTVWILYHAVGWLKPGPEKPAGAGFLFRPGLAPGSFLGYIHPFLDIDFACKY